MRRCGRFYVRLIVLAGLVWLCPRPAVAAGVRLSIEQFNKSRPTPGVEITVEGRVLLLAKNLLRFRNCDLMFRSERALPEFPGGPSNLEVTGEIVRENGDEVGKEFFQIASLRELPTDLEIFQQQRRSIRGENPGDWYKLADRAEERGRFYKDRELLARAEDARTHAIAIEKRQATRDGPAALLALAAKAGTLQLPKAVPQLLVHEAYHQLWQDSKTQPAAKLETLASQMSRDLPGCSERLAHAESDLWAQYRLKPLETYEAADGPTRRKIHRLIYADVLLRSIVSTLSADGKNAVAVAEAIDRQVPEEHALAESYREKALAARAAAADKLSRKEMLALAGDYAARKQPREAEQVKRRWLSASRLRLQPDDTEGLLQLAEEYRALLSDKEAAERLLFEAYERNPNAIEVVEQLERLGYHLKNGVWMSQKDFNARPEGKLERAMREGRVEVGMTATQVRQGLGEPTVLSRSIAAGEVNEVWTYSLADSTQFAVHLAKRRGLPELKVVNSAQLGAP